MEAVSSNYLAALQPLDEMGQKILEGKYVSKSEKNDRYRLCLVKNGLKPESLYINPN